MTDKQENTQQSDLSKKFFEINDIKMEEIDLSPFNGPKGIYAKAISMKDFQDLSKKCTVLKQGIDPKKATPEDFEFSDDFVACNIAASVCDRSGNLIFSEDEIPAILQKSRQLFEVVSSCVCKMNDIITNEEVDKQEKK